MTTTLSSILDLRAIAPQQRHTLIFSAFADLLPGQSFELVNDHDPRPLKQQFELRSPGQFSWNYVEQGPQVWRVEIAKTASAVNNAGGCCSGGGCGG